MEAAAISANLSLSPNTLSDFHFVGLQKDKEDISGHIPGKGILLLLRLAANLPPFLSLRFLPTSIEEEWHSSWPPTKPAAGAARGQADWMDGPLSRTPVRAADNFRYGSPLAPGGSERKIKRF